MATPFTPKAFTPPSANDPASIVRAILQLQQAFGGSGTVPQNNLNVLQNNTPPNTPLFGPRSHGGGGGSGTGPTGPTGPTGIPGQLTNALPYAGNTGATFHFNITSTLGWPLCGFGQGANLPANAWVYTPQASGQLLVTVQASIVAPTAQNAMARLMYGSGNAASAPGFGGTGGAPVQFGQGMIGTQAGVFQAITLQGIVNGLTVGQPYWFDIALLSNSPGAATVGQVTPNSPPIWTVVEL